jgi:hypothetical protein
MLNIVFLCDWVLVKMLLREPKGGQNAAEGGEPSAVVKTGIDLKCMS